MATTVAQHQLTPYTDPQNGQTPIDADQVTANDNGTVTGFNAHDADPGIHLQSSALGSRPAAGVAGRKWLTSDGLRLYLDDGANWQEVAYLSLADGGTVAGATTFSAGITGDLTGNVTGDLTGNADTASALATARQIALGGVLSGAQNFDGSGNITITAAFVAGSIVNADINASAGIVDTKLATISTAGKVANSATTAASANTASAIVARDGSGDFAAGTITCSGLIHTGTSITLRGVAYVLPAADGSSGQVLSTDGAGNLSWAAASAGFVTGSGTTGRLPKFTSSSGLGDSIVNEVSGMIRVGTSPGQAGIIGLPNDAWITGRNAANNGDLNIIRIAASGVVQIAATSITASSAGGLGCSTLSVGSTFTWGGVGYTPPVADGSSGQFLQTNGSGTLTWATAGGGITGLTTGKIPKAASASTLTDSIMTESGSTISVAGTVSATTLTASGTVNAQVIDYDKAILTSTTIGGGGGSVPDNVMVVLTAVSNPNTITLPAAASHTGRLVWVKRDGAGSGNVNVVVSGGGNIDGGATFAIDNPYSGAAFFSDGSQWFALAKIG